MRAEAAALACLMLVGCGGMPHGPGGGPHRNGLGAPPDAPGRGPPPDMPGRGPPGTGHARTFISPMGEPFRGEGSGLPPAAAWFAGADANHDGRLTRVEFEADALRFFALLDTDHDGEIGPTELDHYEEVVAPEVRSGGGGGAGPSDGAARGRRGGGAGGGRGGRGGMGGGGGGGAGGGMGGGGQGGGGGRGGGGPGGGGRGQDDRAGTPASAGEPLQGAARFGYLALPEPVIAADADFNRGVSRAEFVAAARTRFALLDRDGDGVLTEAELPRLETRRR